MANKLHVMDGGPGDVLILQSENKFYLIDGGEVKPVDNSYKTNKMYYGTKQAVNYGADLVDSLFVVSAETCGAGSDKNVDEIKPSGIILTHADSDHITGIQAVFERLLSQTYADKATLESPMVFNGPFVTIGGTVALKSEEDEKSEEEKKIGIPKINDLRKNYALTELANNPQREEFLKSFELQEGSYQIYYRKKPALIRTKKPAIAEDKSKPNRSSVISFHIETKVFLTGDTIMRYAKKFIESKKISAISIYKIQHHGSRANSCLSLGTIEKDAKTKLEEIYRILWLLDLGKWLTEVGPVFFSLSPAKEQFDVCVCGVFKESLTKSLKEFTKLMPDWVAFYKYFLDAIVVCSKGEPFPLYMGNQEQHDKLINWLKKVTKVIDNIKADLDKKDDPKPSGPKRKRHDRTEEEQNSYDICEHYSNELEFEFTTYLSSIKDSKKIIPNYQHIPSVNYLFLASGCHKHPSIETIAALLYAAYFRNVKLHLYFNHVKSIAGTIDGKYNICNKLDLAENYINSQYKLGLNWKDHLKAYAATCSRMILQPQWDDSDSQYKIEPHPSFICLNDLDKNHVLKDLEYPFNDSDENLKQIANGMNFKYRCYIMRGDQKLYLTFVSDGEGKFCIIIEDEFEEYPAPSFIISSEELAADKYKVKFTGERYSNEFPTKRKIEGYFSQIYYLKLASASVDKGFHLYIDEECKKFFKKVDESEQFLQLTEDTKNKAEVFFFETLPSPAIPRRTLTQALSLLASIEEQASELQRLLLALALPAELAQKSRECLRAIFGVNNFSALQQQFKTPLFLASLDWSICLDRSRFSWTGEKTQLQLLDVHLILRAPSDSQILIDGVFVEVRHAELVVKKTDQNDTSLASSADKLIGNYIIVADNLAISQVVEINQSAITWPIDVFLADLGVAEEKRSSITLATMLSYFYYGKARAAEFIRCLNPDLLGAGLAGWCISREYSTVTILDSPLPDNYISVATLVLNLPELKPRLSLLGFEFDYQHIQLEVRNPQSIQPDIKLVAQVKVGEIRITIENSIKENVAASVYRLADSATLADLIRVFPGSPDLDKLPVPLLSQTLLQDLSLQDLGFIIEQPMSGVKYFNLSQAFMVVRLDLSQSARQWYTFLPANFPLPDTVDMAVQVFEPLTERRRVGLKVGFQFITSDHTVFNARFVARPSPETSTLRYTYEIQAGAEQREQASSLSQILSALGLAEQMASLAPSLPILTQMLDDVRLQNLQLALEPQETRSIISEFVLELWLNGCWTIIPDYLALTDADLALHYFKNEWTGSFEADFLIAKEYWVMARLDLPTRAEEGKLEFVNDDKTFDFAKALRLTGLSVLQDLSQLPLIADLLAVRVQHLEIYISPSVDGQLPSFTGLRVKLNHPGEISPLKFVDIEFDLTVRKYEQQLLVSFNASAFIDNRTRVALSYSSSDGLLSANLYYEDDDQTIENSLAALPGTTQENALMSLLNSLKLLDLDVSLNTRHQFRMDAFSMKTVFGSRLPMGTQWLTGLRLDYQRASDTNDGLYALSGRISTEHIDLLGQVSCVSEKISGQDVNQVSTNSVDVTLWSPPRPSPGCNLNGLLTMFGTNLHLTETLNPRLEEISARFSSKPEFKLENLSVAVSFGVTNVEQVINGLVGGDGYDNPQKWNEYLPFITVPAFSYDQLDNAPAACFYLDQLNQRLALSAAIPVLGARAMLVLKKTQDSTQQAQQPRYSFCLFAQIDDHFRFEKVGLSEIDKIIRLQHVSMAILQNQQSRTEFLRELTQAKFLSATIADSLFPKLSTQTQALGAEKLEQLEKGLWLEARLNWQDNSNAMTQRLTQMANHQSTGQTGLTYPELYLATYMGKDLKSSKAYGRIDNFTLSGGKLVLSADVLCLPQHYSEPRLHTDNILGQAWLTMTGELELDLAPVKLNFTGSLNLYRRKAKFRTSLQILKSLEQPLGVKGISLRELSLAINWHFSDEVDHQLNKFTAALFATAQISWKQYDQNAKEWRDSSAFELKSSLLFVQGVPAVLAMQLNTDRTGKPIEANRQLPIKRLSDTFTFQADGPVQWTPDYPENVLELRHVSLYFARLPDQQTSIKFGNRDFLPGFHLTADTRCFGVDFHVDLSIQQTTKQLSLTGSVNSIEFKFVKLHKVESDSLGPSLSFKLSPNKPATLELSSGISLFDTYLGTIFFAYSYDRSHDESIFKGGLIYQGKLLGIDKPSLAFSYSEKNGLRIDSLPMNLSQAGLGLEIDYVKVLEEGSTNQACEAFVKLGKDFFDKLINTRWDVKDFKGELKKDAAHGMDDSYILQASVNLNWYLQVKSPAAAEFTDVCFVEMVNLKIELRLLNNATLSDFAKELGKALINSAANAMREVLTSPAAMSAFFAEFAMSSWGTKVIAKILCRTPKDKNGKVDKNVNQKFREKIEAESQKRFNETLPDSRKTQINQNASRAASSSATVTASTSLAGAAAALETCAIAAGLIGVAAGEVILLFNSLVAALGAIESKERERLEEQKRQAEADYEAAKQHIQSLLNAKSGQFPSLRFSRDDTVIFDWSTCWDQQVVSNKVNFKIEFSITSAFKPDDIILKTVTQQLSYTLCRDELKYLPQVFARVTAEFRYYENEARNKEVVLCSACLTTQSDLHITMLRSPEFVNLELVNLTQADSAISELNLRVEFKPVEHAASYRLSFYLSDSESDILLTHEARLPFTTASVRVDIPAKHLRRPVRGGEVLVRVEALPDLLQLHLYKASDAVSCPIFQAVLLLSAPDNLKMQANNSGPSLVVIWHELNRPVSMVKHYKLKLSVDGQLIQQYQVELPQQIEPVCAYSIPLSQAWCEQYSGKLIDCELFAIADGLALDSAAVNAAPTTGYLAKPESLLTVSHERGKIIVSTGLVEHAQAYFFELCRLESNQQPTRIDGRQVATVIDETSGHPRPVPAQEFDLPELQRETIALFARVTALSDFQFLNSCTVASNQIGVIAVPTQLRFEGPYLNLYWQANSPGYLVRVFHRQAGKLTHLYSTEVSQAECLLPAEILTADQHYTVFVSVAGEYVISGSSSLDFIYTPSSAHLKLTQAGDAVKVASHPSYDLNGEFSLACEVQGRGLDLFTRECDRYHQLRLSITEQGELIWLIRDQDRVVDLRSERVLIDNDTDWHQITMIRRLTEDRVIYQLILDGRQVLHAWTDLPPLSMEKLGDIYLAKAQISKQIRVGEFLMWSRALSEQEWQMNSVVPNPAELIGYWPIRQPAPLKDQAGVNPDSIELSGEVSIEHPSHDWYIVYS